MKTVFLELPLSIQEIMNTKANFFHETLFLGEDWVVDEGTTDESTETIHVYISHAGGEVVCPETGERGPAYDLRKSRQWRHLDHFQYKCILHCRIPRSKSSAGVKTIRIPWASGSDRFTHMFARRVIDVLKATESQSKTAQLMGCNFRLVHRVMHRAVDRGMERRVVEEFRHLSIDEKAFAKRYQFATIVSNGDLGYVIDLVEGRDEKSATALVERILPRHMRDRIETITSDMWKAFLNLAENLLPDARLVHDRFHLIKILNKALNNLRRQEAKSHPETLKSSRYALLKNPENRTEKQEEIFQTIMDANLKVGVLWQQRENFKAIFRCSSPAEAMTYLKLWLASVRKTGIEQAIKVADTFEEHINGVCNALWCEQSNAKAERINGKIQRVLTIARGFRNFENFRVAVLFFHGNLSLYPQELQ